MRYGWDTAKPHSHAMKCRIRFEELFRHSEDDKHRVNEADQMQNRWLAEQVREADLPANGGVVEEQHPVDPPTSRFSS